ncbi:MAG: hypothetical protein ACERKO_08925 [Acetanaerobacterium sp.]
MPSTYKTEQMGLNQWLGTDKPKRSDYNEDNERIDTAFATHLDDGQMHITPGERAAWNAPFVTGSYTGDGVNGRTIPLDFTPRILILSIDVQAPVAITTGGDLFLRTGFATAFGSTKGLSLAEGGFVVHNAPFIPPDGESPKMNMDGCIYFYIAFQ